MIRLNDQPAVLKFTPRVEIHGDEAAPGCTLKLTIKGSNTLLDLLDDNLRTTLYMPKPVDDQDLVEQVSDDGYLPNLRFPMLGKLSWGYETAGYRVVIGGGLNDESDLAFIKCDIKKFSIACEQGGSVSIDFNVNCSPTADEAGRLYELNGQNIDLTLEPPSPEEQAQMEIDAMGGSDDDDDYPPVVSTEGMEPGFAEDAEQQLKDAFADEEDAVA